MHCFGKRQNEVKMRFNPKQKAMLPKPFKNKDALIICHGSEMTTSNISNFRHSAFSLLLINKKAIFTLNAHGLRIIS